MRISYERRRFLRAVGGTAAAAPFVPLLAPPAHAAGPPPRLLVLWTPHGPPWEYLRPRGAGADGAITPASLDYEDSILAPVKAFASQITILEGLSYKCRIDLNTNNGYVGHEDASSVFLSGQPSIRMNQGGGPIAGPTLDQYLASKLAGQTAIPSVLLAMLGAAPHAQSGNNWFSVDAQRRPTAGLMRPDDTTRGLYRRLFEGYMAPGAGTGGEAAAAQELARRRGLVTILARQANRLRARLGAPERQKLEQHLEGLAEIERKLAAPPASARCAVPPPPAMPSGIAAWSEKWGERNGDQELKAIVDVMVQGFACDRTRVAVAYAGMSGPVPWEPLLSGIHDMHHEVAHVMISKDPATQERARRRMAWYMRSLARYWALLLGKLQSIPEGNGTLLDNTIVLWGTEFGDPSGHRGVDAGFVLFGGRNFIQAGHHRKYPTGSTGMTPHNHLLAALCHVFGFPVEGFGPSRYAGVLPGFLKR